MTFSAKVLVTGGAGVFWGNFAEEMIRQGSDVTILDNLVTGFRENLDEIDGAFEFVEGDLNDTRALERSLHGVEVIFHEAALPSVPRSVDNPAETHAACVDGSFNLLLKA